MACENFKFKYERNLISLQTWYKCLNTYGLIATSVFTAFRHDITIIYISFFYGIKNRIMNGSENMCLVRKYTC